MKQAKFIRTVYRRGVPVFEAGKSYLFDERTQHEIGRGNAIEVEVKEKKAATPNDPKSKRAK